MSKSNYELWYTDDLGNRLTYIDDVVAFEYAKVLGDIGAASVTIPSRGQTYDCDIPDRRIAIYRQPNNGRLSLDFMMFARSFQITNSDDGQCQRTILGVDPNELLSRRIVAYYAGSAQAEMTADYTDDIMKEIVRDNFIDNADYSGTPSPARDIDDYSFSVQSDLSDGPTVTKAFAWRNVLLVLQDLQSASKSDGTETFFSVSPVTESALQFRTWTIPRDRTSTGINPIVFSTEWGNISNASLTYSFADEITAAYVGGQGKGVDRNVQLSTDTTGLNRSAFGRREIFRSSNNQTTTSEDDALLDEGADELTRYRARIQFTGELLDTPATPYGGISGWGLGDKVTVNYAGYQLDTIIRSIYVRVDTDGAEYIRARVEYNG